MLNLEALKQELFTQYPIRQLQSRKLALEIIAPIAVGGQAEIYQAMSEQGPVALKLFARCAGRGARLAYIKEWEIAQKLNLPRVIKPLDYGYFKGSFALTFPLMEHHTQYAELVNSSEKRASYTAEDILTLIKVLAETINQIHNKKVIHLDIGPQNLFLSSENELSVIDLGRCRDMENILGSHLIEMALDELNGPIQIVDAQKKNILRRLAKRSFAAAQRNENKTGYVEKITTPTETEKLFITKNECLEFHREGLAADHMEVDWVHFADTVAKLFAGSSHVLKNGVNVSILTELESPASAYIPDEVRELLIELKARVCASEEVVKRVHSLKIPENHQIYPGKQTKPLVYIPELFSLYKKSKPAVS